MLIESHALIIRQPTYIICMYYSSSRAITYLYGYAGLLFAGPHSEEVMGLNPPEKSAQKFMGLPFLLYC